MSTDGSDGDGLDGDKILVGEYALGLLDGAEHERLRRRIASEPALAAELHIWQSRLSGLDGEFAEAAPPPAALDSIEARLFGRPAAPLASLWNNLALWRALAAGGVAVAAIAVGFNLLQPERLDPEAFATQLVAALQSHEGSGVEFVALYDTATGAVRLVGLAGEPIAGRDFELWYIRGDEPAVSMGVIPVDQRTEISLDAEAREKIDAGTVLAVTLEQEGGSPTGVAQGPIVAVGTATPI